MDTLKPIRLTPTSATALLLLCLGGCSTELARSDRTTSANSPGIGSNGAAVGSGGSGALGTGTPGPNRTVGAPVGTAPPGPVFQTPQEFVPAETSLRRLTPLQYQNSLRALLGPTVSVPSDLEPILALEGLVSIGAARLSMSGRATEQFEDVALRATEPLFLDVAWRSAQVPCAPQANVDAACARQFVSTFGKKAWRRPLTTAEIDRWVGVAGAASELLGDFWQGVRWATVGILQSPHFLYRVELGVPSADPTRLALDSYELASKVSYLLWNTTPEDSLLQAADAGLLSTREGLLAQVDRLLASPQARSGLSEFWFDRFRLEDLTHSQHPVNVFPQVTPTLMESMQKETLALAEDLSFTKDADIRGFLNSNTTFVNSELASVYGLPTPAGADLVQATQPADSWRSGYLGQGSFLALNAHQTTSSPTRRGKFVRQVLLCQSIPAPPPNVDTTLPTDPQNPNLTVRQKLEKHRENPTCAACHALLDPIGLGFENFDAIGSLRMTDNGSPIDATGTLDGAAFSNPKELAQLLADRPEFSQCLARGLFRYAAGHTESTGEESAILAIGDSFMKSGYKFQALVRATIDSPAFVQIAPPVK